MTFIIVAFVWPILRGMTTKTKNEFRLQIFYPQLCKITHGFNIPVTTDVASFLKDMTTHYRDNERVVLIKNLVVITVLNYYYTSGFK